MASLKKCIEEMCKSCTYDSTQQGSWRHQTEACTVRNCPLWEVRPMTVATINLNRNKVKPADATNLDALVDGLEDEDDTPVALAA